MSPRPVNLLARAASIPPVSNPLAAAAGGDPWQDEMNANFNRNRGYAQPAQTYTTQLSPQEETAFRNWIAANRVPFNPNDSVADYDMRGYWRDVASKGRSETAVNPNDHRMHFPDTYKTPYHQSFSGESQYAKPGGPVWINDHQLADPRTGQILFDERAQRR